MISSAGFVAVVVSVCCFRCCLCVCVLFFVLSVLIHLLAESVLLFCCEYFCIVDTHRETYARVLNMSEKSGVLVLDKNTLMPQYVN